MRHLIFTLVTIAWSSLLFGQERPIRLLADADGNKESISLSQMNVDVKIFGEIAETRTTMTFFNPQPRVLEGNLYFPLPEKAVISGYALDVNGVMVDGVVVEKNEARRIFEKEERRNIDPGLIEWSKGNNFQTRVYPIPSHGSRTIMVRYISELVHQSGQTIYHLPLDLSEKMKKFHLRVEVVHGVAPPVASQSGTAQLNFKTWRDSYVAETSLEDASIKEDLRITLPQVEIRPTWVEKNENGRFYFCLYDHVAASFVPETKKSKTPSQITIYWDASGSREKCNHQSELNLLRAFLNQRKHNEIKVKLVLFRNAAESPRSFSIVDGKATELLDALNSVKYDGGTQMGVISPTPDEVPPDYYFLFTDGISNFGVEEPTGFKAPVYVFSADSTVNYPFLAYLANKTSGEYFNLSLIDQQAVLLSLGHPVYQFMGARYDSKMIAETYPKTTEPVHGQFTLTGTLLGERAEVILQFGAGGRVLKEAKYMVDRKDATDGELLETFWANKRIQELMIFPERNHNDLVEIGKKYGLVTPGTSLLVLESLEQYMRYRVMPPSSQPEMRKEYQKELTLQKKEDDANRREKIDHILDIWKKRVAWWNHVFPEAPIVKEEKGPSHPVQPSPSTTTPTPIAAPTVSAPLHEQNRRCAVSNYPVSPRESRPHRPGIQGVIKDQTGAVIAGAQICLLNIQSNQAVGIKTTEDGYFIFDNLPEGKFDLVAHMPGFKDFEIHNIDFFPDQRKFIPIILQVGSVSTTVVVEASAPILMSENAEMSATVETDHKTLTTESKIELRAWDPKTPYLDKLKKELPDQRYRAYLEQRREFSSSPAFFLDCAEFFFRLGNQSLGLQVLSNLAEMQLENAALLRIVAHRLAQLEQNELAIQMFESILKMRPEEPQSYRDLALVLAGQRKYERAMELLNHVVMNEWDRFDEIEVIALMELNRIIPQALFHGITKIPLDPRLIQLLDVDLRIVLTWNADATDIDLWVTEPSGEKADYSNPLTQIGGHCSRDFTDGYGPEEYIIHKAKAGKYQIQANFYGSRAQTLQGPVTVQADVYTNYGRQNEKRQRLTLQLNETKETFTVGEIEYVK